MAGHDFNPTLPKTTIQGNAAGLVVPFFRSFWYAAFDQYRFAFFAPRLVARQIGEAERLSGEDGFRVLIAAIGAGIGTKAPEYI